MNVEVEIIDGVAYSMAQSSIMNAGKIEAGQAMPTESFDDSTATGRVAPWGKNNKYPHEVLDKIATATLVKPLLDWKGRALYGGGLVYGILEVDQSGKETYRRIIDSEIEDWLEATDANLYIMEASAYFYTFYNVFPELVQTRDGKKIKWLSCKESVDCRWGLREKVGKNKGLITKCYIKSTWKKDNNAESATVVDVIQTSRGPIEQVKAAKNKKWIYPVFYPSPGTYYYQDAPWHVILDGWLEIAKEIPSFKKSLMKNQVSIKYIITVPEWWWKWKYKDWDSRPDKERIDIVKKEHAAFNDFMVGAEKAGNSLMYTKKDDTPAQKFEGWKIEAVDDKLKEGVYIEDSQEADMHIFKNMQVDPTLFGAGAGKGQASAGSGSDKRVSWNNYIIQTKPHQDLILKPLHFISKFNGWQERLAKADNQKLVFWFKNYMIARLDSGDEIQSQQ